MNAVALNYRERTLVERDVPEPILEDDTQVLFRVREVGICGTDRDLASFRLEFPPVGQEYLILGHECVGDVLRVGSAVQGLGPGDVVVPIVRRPCDPPCRSCSAGRRDLCSSGGYTERGIVGAHGYFTDLAIDSMHDLIRIPAPMRDFAVLIEPLSVVEKAIGNALRLHPGTPESALVLGAGAIGLLTTMALSSRGLHVTVSSLEAVHSERARLAREAGAEYQTKPNGLFDLVIEAAGAPESATTALSLLAPAGVLIFLGVNEAVQVPMLQLILNNQVIAGSVNAAPADFATAVADLARFPAGVLQRMIARERWETYRSTLMGPLRPSPKIVHVLD